MEHFNPKFNGESEKTVTPKSLEGKKKSIAQQLSQMQSIHTHIINSLSVTSPYPQNFTGMSNF